MKKCRTINTSWLVLLGIVVVAAVPFLIRAIDWRTRYLLQIYSIIPILMISSLSLTVITGYAGQVSLAQGALMGFGAYTSAILSSQGVSPLLAVPAGLASAGLGALVLGVPTLRLRGPYFIVSSMAFNGIFYEVVNNWIEVTNGPNGISVHSYGNMPIVGTYLPWVVALLCLVAVGYIGKTRVGKSMMATRDDELAASAIGLRVSFIKSFAFVVSGLLAGLGGILLGYMIGYVSPETFSLNQSVFLLTIVLLGGVRRIEGAILGTLLMVLAQEALRDFIQLQLLLYGTAMLVVILFVPRGVFSLFDRSGRR